MPPKQPIRRHADPYSLLRAPLEVVRDLAAQFPEHRDDSPGLFVADFQSRCKAAEVGSFDEQGFGLHRLPDVGQAFTEVVMGFHWIASTVMVAKFVVSIEVRFR